MKNRSGLVSILVVLFLLATYTVSAVSVYADDYVRASEDPDNVKNKIYPRKKKIEIGVDGGGFLNLSFINTILAHINVNYFLSETWAVNIDYSMGINFDKAERKCVETFYNKTQSSGVQADCLKFDEDKDATLQQIESSPELVNFGPAYMPIREINGIISANLVWTPVYGKQLLLMSATSFFDLFFLAGAGVALSDYYGLQENLKGTNTPSRCKKSTGNSNSEDKFEDGCGARSSSTNLIGEAGRPDPESSILPVVNLSIGQKFHFSKMFSFHIEFRDVLILGAPSGGFENLVAVWGGFNIRI